MHTTVDWGKGAITGDLAITTIMHYLLRRPGSYKISERSIANVSSSICILGLIVWPKVVDLNRAQLIQFGKNLPQM